MDNASKWTQLEGGSYNHLNAPHFEFGLGGVLPFI